MKTKIIPFDLGTAKKIQAGEIEGRIVNECGTPVEIVAFNVKNTPAPIVCIIRSVFDTDSMLSYFKKDGTSIDTSVYSLTIELPEEAPKYKFKPFDKVLVRDAGPFDVWKAGLFSHCNDNGYSCNGAYWAECIPYEGNEHLVGTTDKPE